jgi:hypothetical protein
LGEKAFVLVVASDCTRSITCSSRPSRARQAWALDDPQRSGRGRVVTRGSSFSDLARLVERAVRGGLGQSFRVWKVAPNSSSLELRAESRLSMNTSSDGVIEKKAMLMVCPRES